MTYRYELGSNFFRCPIAWKNFIIFTRKESGTSVLRPAILKGLEPFNCVDYVKCTNGTNSYVIFEDRADAIMFTLTWAK